MIGINLAPKYSALKNYRLLFLCLLLTGVGYGQTTPKTKPLKERLKEKNTTSNVTKYLDEAKWNELFPHRANLDKKAGAGDFYSYKAFLEAAKLFPNFMAEGDAHTQKRELAAFFANISLETANIWTDSAGVYLKWALYYIEEQGSGHKDHYADKTNEEYPPVAGKYYYGRGPVQISWNYNYGQFSEAWFGNKDTLLQHPELLSHDPVLALVSALWFWMTPQYPKPSCHDIMTGKWKPTGDDIKKGRVPGFGATVNVFNGAIECGHKTDEGSTGYRYKYYQYYCKYFGVAPGPNIECSPQRPFGR